jgi:protein involved in temperature-dependent protein secretion
LAWFTTEQIPVFGLGRQRNDVPTLAAALHFRDDAAGKVVLVPAGLDQDHPSARCQPG